MRKILDRFAEILLEPVSKVVTIMLGTYTIIWGLWVTNPWIDTFTSAPLYGALVSFMPIEWLWGLVAVLFGAMTLLGVSRHARRTEFYGAAANGFYWFIISIFYFIGDSANTGGITALFLAILSTYIYLNCKIQYARDNNTSDE